MTGLTVSKFNEFPKIRRRSYKEKTPSFLGEKKSALIMEFIKANYQNLNNNEVI